MSNDAIHKSTMETPPSASKLTSAIRALGAKYRIEEFEAEFFVLAKGFGVSEETLKRSEFNPLMLLEEGRKDDYKRFIKALEKMDAKYNFHEFHDQGVCLRNAFDEERKEYLYNNILTQCIPIMFFFPPEIADQFFEEWLEGVIEEEDSVCLEYETLEGELVQVTVYHKEDELTEDYVECRPINRFVGDTPYDAFMVRYFWNGEEWIAIPIHLIKRYAVN